MPLSVGEKLGPYEILSLIGNGGMGQVWKARDSRLDRAPFLPVVPSFPPAVPHRRLPSTWSAKHRSMILGDRYGWRPLPARIAMLGSKCKGM
jgi:serine/threonine protein kinase